MQRNCAPILLLLLLMADVVSAGDLSDGIAIYSNIQEEANCLPGDLYTPITLYLVLEHPSCMAGVSGWEASLSFSDGLINTLVSLSGGGINMLSYPSFQVGLNLNNILPYADQVTLATLTLFATLPGGCYIHACSPPSLPGTNAPVYASGADPMLLIPMQRAYGSDTEPSFAVGTAECPRENVDRSIVARTAHSWGDVKCLFR